MYNFMALLGGIFIAGMVALNGELTSLYGNYNATFIIHVVGVVSAFVLSKLSGKKLFPKEKLPIWFFSAGAFGIFTTLINNFAFNRISLTGILALNLFGQTICSIFIDSFGLFGMKKHPFHKTSFPGLLFSLLGVAIMLQAVAGVDTLALIAIILSILVGALIVINRTINARLSEHVGVLPGAFFNHLAGLPFTLLLALLVPSNNIGLIAQRPSSNLLIYLGGLLGVGVVVFFNLSVPKLSSFRVTLLSFVGQVFVGILIDLLLRRNFSPISFYGGLIVAAGVAVNMLMEYIENKRKSAAKDSLTR